jgi:hypothetical protein
LLNPHDHPYSVPQLFDFISHAGLQFGRWMRQAAYLPQCGALATFPHQPLLAKLPVPAQYAAVELFRGTMVQAAVTSGPATSACGASRHSSAVTNIVGRQKKQSKPVHRPRLSPRRIIAMPCSLSASDGDAQLRGTRPRR